MAFLLRRPRGCCSARSPTEGKLRRRSVLWSHKVVHLLGPRGPTVTATEQICERRCVSLQRQDDRDGRCKVIVWIWTSGESVGPQTISFLYPKPCQLSKTPGFGCANDALLHCHHNTNHLLHFLGISIYFIVSGICLSPLCKPLDDVSRDPISLQKFI